MSRSSDRWPIGPTSRSSVSGSSVAHPSLVSFTKPSPVLRRKEIGAGIRCGSYRMSGVACAAGAGWSGGVAGDGMRSFRASANL